MLLHRRPSNEMYVVREGYMHIVWCYGFCL